MIPEPAPRAHRLLQLAWLIAPLYVLFVMARMWVDVPYMDEWGSHALTGLVERKDDWLSVLFAQHNEHRLVFTRLIFLANDLLFAGNRLPLLVLNWLIVGATLAVPALALSRLRPIGSKAFATWLLAASCLLFHPAAGGVWLWAFAVQIPLCQLLFVLAVHVFAGAGAPWRRAGGAIALAAASVLASANGLVTLPVLVLMAWSQRERPTVKAVLLAATVLVTGAYFQGYVRPSHGEGVGWGLRESMLYFFAFLGAPFGVNQVPVAAAFGAMGMGLAALALVLWAKRRGPSPDRTMLPWFCWMILPVGSAAMGALGRTGFGVEQALQSRYMVMSGLFWVALSGALLALNVLALRRARVAAQLVGGAATLAFLATQFGYVAYYQQKYPHVAFAAGMMRAGGYHPDVWELLYPDPAYLLAAASYHEARGLSPFNRPTYPLGQTLEALGLQVSDKPAEGAIEAVSRVPSLPAASNGYFRPAAEFRGHLKPGGAVEHIVLVDRDGLVHGLGFYGLQTDPRRMSVSSLFTSPTGWRGFALGAHPDGLKAYVVYRGDAKAYPLRRLPP